MRNEMFSMELSCFGIGQDEWRGRRGLYDVREAVSMRERFFTGGFDIEGGDEEISGGEIFLDPNSMGELAAIIVDPSSNAEEVFRRAKRAASALKYEWARQNGFEEEIASMRMAVLTPLDILGENQDAYRFFLKDGRPIFKGEKYDEYFVFYKIKESDLDSMRLQLHQMRV